MSLTKNSGHVLHRQHLGALTPVVTNAAAHPAESARLDVALSLRPAVPETTTHLVRVTVVSATTTDVTGDDLVVQTTGTER